MRRRSNKADISEPFKKSLSGRTGSWSFRKNERGREICADRKTVRVIFIFQKKLAESIRQF